MLQLRLQARKLVRDIRPKMVVVPEKYTVPPVQAPGRTELVVDTEVTISKKNLNPALLFYAGAFSKPDSE